MTVRFTENKINIAGDSNKAGSLVELTTANGRNAFPALDATNVRNIPGTGTVGTVTQRFDSYEPVTVNITGTTTNTAVTIQPGKIYIIDHRGTSGVPPSFGSQSVSFTINEAAFNQGDRFAILMNRVNGTNGNPLSFGISVTTGSSGTASRVCANGICYSNATTPADTTMGTVISGILSYQASGGTAVGTLRQGDCFEFIRYSDGIRTGFFEKSHFAFFETTGGTTVAGNWANFDNVIGTNAASGTGIRYTLVYDGTDWRWRTTGQDTTAVNFANGTTNTLALPTNHQYMDQLIFLCTIATIPWSTGYTLNLTNFSSLPRDQIHMKPLVFVLGGSTAQNVQNSTTTWPGYIVRFTDTTADVTIQQIFNTAENTTSPFTQQNAIGIEDSSYGSTTAHHNANAGIVIAYDWDNKRWYRIRKLIRFA